MRTTKKSETPKPSRQVLVVENAEADILKTNETAQEEKASEATVVEPIQPPESPQRKIFEDLIFLGSISDVVEIQGHKFKISTLTHRENNSLMREVYKFGGEADLFIIRTLTLAQCVRSVDDVPLEQLEVDGEFGSDYEKKLAILDSMQNSVIEELFDFYTKLDETGKKNIKDDGEKIKN
jgi:hypothetical protein